VRRAVAIQMIINKELGLNFNENPWQGSYVVEELTDLVEEAVYKESEAISERGGVLGAMDTMYQRGKIQEESLYYEHKKHDGSLPLIGVNTFLPKEHGGEVATDIELIRSTEEEKGRQKQTKKGTWLIKPPPARPLGAADRTAAGGGSSQGGFHHALWKHGAECTFRSIMLCPARAQCLCRAKTRVSSECTFR
jgi:methylmalonyl-CoA mutase